MANQHDIKQTEAAFKKFMEKLMGGLGEATPAFYKGTGSGSKVASKATASVGQEGDGYASREGDGYARHEGWDGIERESDAEIGCTNCEDCDCYGDEEESQTTTTISFTVSGPSDFAEEIGQDIYRLLLDLRGDAIAYSKKTYAKDAPDLVAVSVSIASSTD